MGRVRSGVDATTLLASSVVAAGVSGVFSFATQQYLLKRKEQIDYRLPARQRLYQAIGPLRLQLIFSARDLVRRVSSHPRTRWNLDPSQYYASSFMWRLLRPVAIGQLIQRQMTVADFAVDPASLHLLRLNAAMEEALTGGQVVEGLSGIDWGTQTQHLFGDNLRVAAAKLLFEADGADRVMDFAQFAGTFPNPTEEPALRDLATIFVRCQQGGSLLGNPVFWLRVVAYTYICHSLISSQGADLGFEPPPLDVQELLARVPDEQISSRAGELPARFEAILAGSL
jgi:hypothetical protein